MGKNGKRQRKKAEEAKKEAAAKAEKSQPSSSASRFRSRPSGSERSSSNRSSSDSTSGSSPPVRARSKRTRRKADHGVDVSARHATTGCQRPGFLSTVGTADPPTGARARKKSRKSSVGPDGAEGGTKGSAPVVRVSTEGDSMEVDIAAAEAARRAELHRRVDAAIERRKMMSAEEMAEERATALAEFEASLESNPKMRAMMARCTSKDTAAPPILPRAHASSSSFGMVPATGEDGGNDGPSGLSGRPILGDVSPNKLRVKGRFTGNIAGGAASSITPAPAPPTRRLVRRSISSFDVAKTKYSGWSCKELMKKIAEINDDITDEKEKLSPSGLKEDMVRTLVRHDVALSMDRHSRLQHPDPAEGWDLVRNVTLQAGNFTDPKSRFGLRVDSKGPGTGAVIVKVSTKIEANVKAGDVVVAANGQIVFDVSTMKEIRSYDITAVTKLMKGTAGGHPLSVDVLRRRGGEKKVSTEQPMAEQPKATAGLSISASSRGRRRRRSADSEVMDQNAIVGGKRERIRPVSSTYSFSYSQSSGDDENRCDIPGLPLLQKDRAVDSDDDASDEEFDANDEDIINFRAPASRRKIQTSEFYLADDGDRIDDPSPRQIRAGGLKQVRLRSLLADQGNFGDGSVVSETDIDATRFECLVSQDLNDLAAQGLMSLQRGNSGQECRANRNCQAERFENPLKDGKEHMEQKKIDFGEEGQFSQRNRTVIVTDSEPTKRGHVEMIHCSCKNMASFLHSVNHSGVSSS